MRIKYTEKMYNSPGIGRLEKYYKWALEKCVGDPDIYAITINDNTGALEIIHAKYLQQSWYKTHPVTVTGLATDREEALSVVAALKIAGLE